MISKFLIFLCLFVVCEAMAKEHLQIGCGIFETSGKQIGAFGGGMCIFLNDGSFVRYSGGFGKATLQRDDLDGNLVWKRNQINLHHQMKLSADGRRILSLGSTIKKSPLCDVDDESAIVIDLETGKTLHEWSILDHLREVESNRKLSPWPILRYGTRIANDEKPVCLLSHLNSINEIPPNPYSKRNPAFAEGNLIVNFNVVGFIGIFDSHLKKLLWTSTMNAKKSVFGNYHDVKVDSSGKILFYHNNYNDENLSRIVSFDPETQERVKIFPMKETNAFFADINGAFQFPAEGGIALNASTDSEGGYFAKFDKDETLLWKVRLPFMNPKTNKPAFFQEGLLADFSGFLSKNISTRYAFSKKVKTAK